MEDKLPLASEADQANESIVRKPCFLKGTAKVMGLFAVLLIAFALGYVVRAGCTTVQLAPISESETFVAPEAKSELWTCSMHPNIQLPKSGNCPICHMALIRVEDDISEEHSPIFATSPAGRALMDIQTSPVERRYVTAEIRMVGKIDYDESRLVDITAKVPGRLDRLFADYTGLPVRKGDHMVEIYSPELLATQEELLQAIKAVRDLEKSHVDSIRRSADATVAAVRERLRLWGLTLEQIAEIEDRGATTDHVTLHAPASGIVIHKHAQEGAYVKIGSPIYSLADLSHVWAMLDAYESDLIWLRFGQSVEIVSDAYPDEVFVGKIVFIDPVLHEKTRTVKIRVNLPNPEGRLKPAMFVRGVVRPKIGARGRVMAPELSGKWMCPMHPAIVKDTAGICDICQMDLVTAQSLGYSSLMQGDLDMPLVIPATAPLITGARAVVYVEVPYSDRPTFEGREIILGPRAGDFYIVNDGLEAGEQVVTHGNFKIDSALQIQARDSMMLPRSAPIIEHLHAELRPEEFLAATPAPEIEIPHRFRQQLTSVFDGYLGIQLALSRDDLVAATDASRQASSALDSVDMTLLKGQVHMAWMKQRASMLSTLESMQSSLDIAQTREAFKTLSKSLEQSIMRFQLEAGRSVYVLHCPMVSDNAGADWLQDDPDVRNPYYGASMLKCGEISATLLFVDETLRPGGYTYE